MTDALFRPVFLRLPSTWTLLALASGCVPDFGVDLSAIRAPKLLAIASSPAEVKGQESTTLSALVAVPPGSGARAVSWSMCLERKPLTELGPVNAACLDPDSNAERIELGRGVSATATLPEDTCRLFGPRRPMQTAEGPAGRPVDPDITGGFYQPVIANLDGVASLGAVRIACDPANLNRDDALRYRALYRVNENPVITTLSFGVGDDPVDRELPADGAPLEMKAGSRVTLRASWDECPTESTCGDGYCTANEDKLRCEQDCGTEPRGCAGSEPYVWYNRETQRIEPRREGIAVAWFTSSGGFETEQTGLAEAEAASVTHTQNRWRVGESPGMATLWVVVRDSRGGQSWVTIPVQITP
jgi:hypothetical protein